MTRHMLQNTSCVEASTVSRTECPGALTISRDQTLENQKAPNAGSTVQCVAASKGKGRVVRCSNAAASRQSSLQLTHVSQSDVENGDSDRFPRPRFLARLRDAWVDCKNMDQPGDVHQAYAMMRASTPVKLCGSLLTNKLLPSWSLSHLVSLMDPQRTWSILCSLQRDNSFIETAAEKNVFGSYYHVREPKTQKLQMTFKEYVQCAKHWTSRRIILQNTVQCRLQQDSQVPECVPELGIEMSQELQKHIRWDWLQTVQKLGRLGPVSKVSLLAAGYNSLLPAKYDTYDRLLAQVCGCQRVLLVPPEYAFKGMYPYPVHHPYDAYSMIDLEQPDLIQWPKNAHVKGLCCIIKPGDVLYLPAYWFAHVQQLEQENISLAFHVGQGRKVRPSACIPLQVSRHLEFRLAEAEGIPNVRHWLRLIGYCEEQDWIDLATVKGYRRIVMCQEVRDELDANFKNDIHAQDQDQDTLAEWQEVLIAMCDGRLMPTPWLNKDFREPLYLTDVPVQIEDTRSAEEQKYPELFRHKLQAQGWSAPDSKSTIAIPGYNTTTALRA